MSHTIHSGTHPSLLPLTRLLDIPHIRPSAAMILYVLRSASPPTATETCIPVSSDAQPPPQPSPFAAMEPCIPPTTTEPCIHVSNNARPRPRPQTPPQPPLIKDQRHTLEDICLLKQDIKYWRTMALASRELLQTLGVDYGGSWEEEDEPLSSGSLATSSPEVAAVDVPDERLSMMDL
ncbi:hypothetical protein C8R44DRAFT_872075 [Mycena epipterygia]|nr:hypothetical protein C8R44DRAFT_872075 [Mycena epipterygia]